MEITIDTSQLTPNVLNSQSTHYKIEDDVYNAITNSIEKQEISKETVTIEIEQIIYHNFDINSIVIYSKIIKNNQNRYSILLNTFFIVFIEDISLIKSILSKVNRNIKHITVNIDECIVIPMNNNDNYSSNDVNFLNVFGYLLPSLIKLFICIVNRHSYNKNNSILINASCLTESMLLCKAISLLGYTPYFNTHNNEKWSDSNECKVVSLDDNDSYNFIIDLTGNMLRQKRKLFSILKYGGMFYGVNYNSDDYSNNQFIPDDFCLMQMKGVGICLMSITQAIHLFVDYGKMINFCLEIFNKKMNSNAIKCISENMRVNVIDISKLAFTNNSFNMSFIKGVNAINFHQ